MIIITVEKSKKLEERKSGYYLTNNNVYLELWCTKIGIFISIQWRAWLLYHCSQNWIFGMAFFQQKVTQQ